MPRLAARAKTNFDLAFRTAWQCIDGLSKRELIAKELGSLVNPMTKSWNHATWPTLGGGPELGFYFSSLVSSAYVYISPPTVDSFFNSTFFAGRAGVITQRTTRRTVAKTIILLPG